MISLLIACSVFAAAEGDVITGPVELVAEGLKFTEGPLWLPSGELIFSDVGADTIYREDKGVVRKPSGGANGLALDGQGRLVCCEGQNRRITRTEQDGSITVLAERYEGKRLNSTNDVAVRSDGAIYFTDPKSRRTGDDADLDFSGVYLISPDGVLSLLDDTMDYPNGVALSPDEKTLYVSDTMKAHIRAFDVTEDGVEKGRVFCEVRIPDGMAVDARGYVWSTSAGGIAVFDPEGTPVATFKIPIMPTNCAFGGADLKTLYVTARSRVFKVRCAAPGLASKATGRVE